MTPEQVGNIKPTLKYKIGRTSTGTTFEYSVSGLDLETLDETKSLRDKARQVVAEESLSAFNEISIFSTKEPKKG